MSDSEMNLTVDTKKTIPLNLEAIQSYSSTRASPCPSTWALSPEASSLSAVAQNDVSDDRSGDIGGFVDDDIARSEVGDEESRAVAEDILASWRESIDTDIPEALRGEAKWLLEASVDSVKRQTCDFRRRIFEGEEGSESFQVELSNDNQGSQLRSIWYEFAKGQFGYDHRSSTDLTGQIPTEEAESHSGQQIEALTRTANEPEQA